MSFRDEVNSTTKSVMVETFITSLFSDPHRRFGDIIEDLLDNDDPDDDWMRDTLYDIEVIQLVQAGMKVLGLSGNNSDEQPDQSFGDEDNEEEEVDKDDDISDNDDIVTIEESDEDDGVEVAETEDGIEYSMREASEESDEDDEEDSDSSDDNEADTNGDNEEEPEEEPKKKKRKKKSKGGKKRKKLPPPENAAPRKKRKAVDAKKSRKDVEKDKEWEDYKKLVVKTLRANKAYDEETAVSNSVILNDVHGEDEWDKDEAAQLRTALSELAETEKIDKVGQRRGTRYYLN